MNLISLPSNPASTNVNDVFGATSQIELIFTFEGAQSKVALRNPDNPSEFVGTLDSIDSQHAYWVSSSNAAEVEINIPPTSQLAPPPYIAVSGGQWNLLPVISLEAVDGGAAPGTEIDADAYLGDFRTAFGWNGRSWAKIDPDPAGDDRLTEGEGPKSRSEWATGSCTTRTPSSPRSPTPKREVSKEAPGHTGASFFAGNLRVAETLPNQRCGPLQTAARLPNNLWKLPFAETECGGPG